MFLPVRYLEELCVKTLSFGFDIVGSPQHIISLHFYVGQEILKDAKHFNQYPLFNLSSSPQE